MVKVVEQPQVMIEDLFQDYDVESFQAQPVLFERVGEEKW